MCGCLCVDYYEDSCRFLAILIKRGIEWLIMLETIDFTSVSIAVIAVVGGVFGLKAVLGHQDSSAKSLKSRIKVMEDNEKWLRNQVQKYKNKASNMERGPQLDYDESDLGGSLGSMLGEFSDFLPKWAQPLLKDPETSKQIIDYLQKNPDKLKSIFGRVIGKKNEEEKSTDDSLGV